MGGKGVERESAWREGSNKNKQTKWTARTDVHSSVVESMEGGGGGVAVGLFPLKMR